MTWADGDGADKIISIPLVADGSPEGSQNFTVTLSAPTGGSVIVDAPEATVNIVDPGAIDSTFVADFINGDFTRTLVQPDGKILIAGGFFELLGGRTHVGIARINSAGTVDTTFGADGGAGTDTTVFDLARQPDGKILVVGNFTTMNGTARNRVARLNGDGSLDTGFTGPDFAQASGWHVDSLALQADGKLLAGGSY
ncbi:delta-60 repeat domain-containing protein [Luteolibacter arcticus]|uniref:Delta-60 repeat domain-containing protein n=1 Tax=Luteolibacter arcticus TaxID=1581411 RepID=A0ABT3GLR8_9BACT|nr:delta-60 repeat domain-containing protein [Luteolibacter arcticus]MCW1924475.1 delta-60 repeat domain-containing protein [Luteolibacter arcticus]